jgi:hypothetical protein
VAETRDEGKKSDEKDEENTTEEALSEGKSSQRKRREIPVNEDSNGKESAKADVQPVSTHKHTTASQNSTYTKCPKSLLRSLF